jgi:hypothetical protein
LQVSIHFLQTEKHDNDYFIQAVKVEPMQPVPGHPAGERYARMYAAQNGKMPRGLHRIEPPHPSDGRKTLDVNFDTLTEYARLRREGKIFF